MMKHKHSTAVFLALCTLLNLTACADSASSGTDESPAEQSSLAADSGECTSENSGAEQTAAPLESAAETVTLPAGETPVLCKKMQSVSIPAGVSAIVPAGGSKAAVSANNGTCYIVDLAADQIISQIRLRNDYERALGVNQAGTELITLVSNAEETVLRFYAIADGSCTELNYNGSCFHIRYDRHADQLYGWNSYQVCTVSKQGADTVRYEVSDKVQDSISVYFTRSGLIVESQPGYDDAYVAAVRNISDGKALFSVPTHASTFYSCSGNLLRFDSELVYGTQEEQSNCTVFDEKTGSRICEFGVCKGSYFSAFADEESRYLMISENTQDEYKLTSVRLFDAQTGKTENLPFELKNANEVMGGYLPALGCWAAAVTCEQENDKYSSELYRIDPAQAKFSQEAAPLNGLDSARTTELGCDMKAAREQADAIEQKYGVRILIGNEVNAVKDCGYRVVSTEDHDGTYIDADITGDRIEQILPELDNKLSRYPDGFFAQFRTDGMQGLRIPLAGALLSWDPDGPGAAGAAFQSGSWFNAAVDWTTIDPIDKTLHHEIFHCVEQLMARKGYSFDGDQWDALNPADFTYGDHAEGLPVEQMPVIGLESQRETGYFARPYGMTNAMEDRATIAEYCFGSWFGKSGYDIIRDYPHTKAKLDYMEQILKECFGTSYLSEIFRS